MKIGIDARVLLDDHYSGVANFSLNLIDNILKKDNLNNYSFFSNSFKKKELNLPKEKLVQTFYPNKVFNYLMQRTLKYPKIDKVLGGVDLLYFPHINFFASSESVKKVITVHDLSFLLYPEFFSFRKNFWHKSLNIANNLKKFDKIVSVSENTKRDIVEILGIEESKVEVVYPGLNLRINENCSFRSKYGIKEGREYILYLGTIEPRKNIVKIIKAYNLLRENGFDHLLVLAGSWGWKTKDIKREWKRSKYCEDIVFTSYVDEADKSCFYKEASVFVYPSFYEGFGFPPLEAMKFDVPVIASNSSSLPEILSDSAILINPDKEFELYEAISSVLSSSSLRESLLLRSRKRVNDFSWDKSAEKYLKIFNSL